MVMVIGSGTGCTGIEQCDGRIYWSWIGINTGNWPAVFMSGIFRWWKVRVMVTDRSGV